MLNNMICPRCWGNKVLAQAESCTTCKGSGTVPDQQLSEHFTLGEMLRSNTAIRMGIPNDPSAFIISDLKLVCSALLEPIREAFGTIHIDSGYRSPELNAAIGGSKTSAHCYGLAADINIQGSSRKKIVEWIYNSLPSFDQVIFEGTWVHIASNTKGWSYNRKQSLMMFAGKYSPYDPNDPRINT